jgi:hypothetical protein
VEVNKSPLSISSSLNKDTSTPLAVTKSVPAEADHDVAAAATKGTSNKITNSTAKILLFIMAPFSMR